MENYAVFFQLGRLCVVLDTISFACEGTDAKFFCVTTCNKSQKHWEIVLKGTFKSAVYVVYSG